MKTYVILTTLTEEGKKKIQNNPEKTKLSAESVAHRGGEIVEQFALLGPYDFLTIIRVKEEKAIYRIASEMGAMGTVKTMTLPAITIDAFINDIKGE
ncbi:MAG: GYD domain-containing protein [Proteobacteria bacterium]|nr:GYD domain-containing protein [Pseudomonadota bacterium]